MKIKQIEVKKLVLNFHFMLRAAEMVKNIVFSSPQIIDNNESIGEASTQLIKYS